MARAGDGTYLYLIAEDGEARLYLGTPAPDSLDVTLDGGTTLVGQDGVLQSGDAQPGTAMVVTDEDELLLAWTQDGQAFFGSCSLQGDAARVKLRQSYSAPHQLGPGVPTDVALDSRNSRPVFVGFSPAEEGTIWVARREGASWSYERIAHEQGEARPQVSVSELGVVHVVWRDTKGTVWHLESTGGGPWLRSGGTSRMPEPIGTAEAAPALLCARHQLLVALPTQTRTDRVFALHGPELGEEPAAHGTRPAVGERPIVGPANAAGRPRNPVAILCQHNRQTEVRLLHALARLSAGTRFAKAGGSSTSPRISSTTWRPSRIAACRSMSDRVATNSASY